MISLSQRILLLFVFGLFMASCVSPERIVYLNDIERQAQYSSPNDYQLTIKPDDLLLINVTNPNQELVQQFTMGMSTMNASSDPTLRGYLVDSDGNINFPTLGKVKLGGLTRNQAIAELQKGIDAYVTDAVINFRILNFKVNVLGEVQSPGQKTFNSERVTILDALAASGDLSLMGKRHNVLLIRDENGKKTYTRLDLGSADLMQSPYYYLAQNDIIYVEPNQTRINSSVIGSDITVIMSLVTFAMTLTLFFIRLN